MDGENNGKPLLKWMIWGGKSTIFGNIHMKSSWHQLTCPKVRQMWQIDSITCQQIVHKRLHHIVVFILFHLKNAVIQVEKFNIHWWEKETPRRKHDPQHTTWIPMKTNREDLTFLRLADFQDLEAERARSSQLETQRQELEAPSIHIHPLTFFGWCFDLGTDSCCRSFLVWWRLGLTGWPFLIFVTWNVTFRHLRLNFMPPSRPLRKRVWVTWLSVSRKIPRFVGDFLWFFVPGTNGCTGRSKCSCRRSWQIIEGHLAFSSSYDFKHREPMGGSGKFFVKAVRMFARKKGVMVMNCSKYQRAWKLFTQESEEKCQALWHFGCIWITMDNQCTNRYPTSLLFQWNYTYTLQQTGLQSHTYDIKLPDWSVTHVIICFVLTLQGSCAPISSHFQSPLRGWEMKIWNWSWTKYTTPLRNKSLFSRR